MRGKLKHEGFEPSDKLPPDWLYKEVSSSNYQRLAEDGNLIELIVSANKDIKSSGVFSSTDSENIEVFAKEKAQERLSTLSNWQEDKNRPKGWKSRRSESTNGKRSLLSPNNQQFPDRKGGLQYIFKQEGWAILRDTWKFCDISILRGISGCIITIYLPQKGRNQSSLPSKLVLVGGGVGGTLLAEQNSDH